MQQLFLNTYVWYVYQPLLGILTYRFYVLRLTRKTYIRSVINKTRDPWKWFLLFLFQNWNFTIWACLRTVANEMVKYNILCGRTQCSMYPSQAIVGAIAPEWGEYHPPPLPHSSKSALSTPTHISATTTTSSTFGSLPANSSDLRWIEE